MGTYVVFRVDEAQLEKIASDNTLSDWNKDRNLDTEIMNQFHDFCGKKMVWKNGNTAFRNDPYNPFWYRHFEEELKKEVLRLSRKYSGISKYHDF